MSDTQQENIQIEKTFAQKQLEELGITPEINRSPFIRVSGETLTELNITDLDNRDIDLPIFTETSSGDLKIRYQYLNGSEEEFTPSYSRWKKPFWRIRLHPSKEKEGMKYIQPEKSGTHIFFPPGIVKAYREGIKMETPLFIFEGEKKAFKADMQGIYAIGLPGKDQYHEAQKKTLHPDIIELIRVCQPSQVCLLLDNDVRFIDWDKWTADPDNFDLGKRLNGFFRTIADFRESADKHVSDFFWGHINENQPAKGFDDLLIANAEKADEICNDLIYLKPESKWFYIRNLSAENPNKLRDYFFLKTDKTRAPRGFYFNEERNISARIGVTPFVFLKSKFQYDNNTGELILLKHGDSELYLRIGCNYVKIVETLNEKGRPIRDIKDWKKSELNTDYISKGHKNFIDGIEKFDDVINFPDNTENYKRAIISPAGSRLYNMYYPVDHRPLKGEWKSTDMFLRHVSQNEFQDKYELLLDWIYLVFFKPHQRLWIPCFVSPEQNTGKSTFVDLMELIFGRNLSRVGNDEINDIYNDNYINSSVVAIEEALLEKKANMERLKNWVTAPRINLSAKFKSRTAISNFMHFIINSNNVRNFVTIEDNDTRFMVLRVPVIKQRDPDLLSKMEDEIPAFLEFLQTRTTKYPRIDRLWHSSDLFDTAARREVQRNSTSFTYKIIYNLLRETFQNLNAAPRDAVSSSLSFTVKLIMQLVNTQESGIKLNELQIRNCLQDEFKLQPNPLTQRFYWPVWKSRLNLQNEDEEYIDWIKSYPKDKDNVPLRGNIYTAFAIQFLPEAERSDTMQDAIARKVFLDTNKQTVTEVNPIPPVGQLTLSDLPF